MFMRLITNWASTPVLLSLGTKTHQTIILRMIFRKTLVMMVFFYNDDDDDDDDSISGCLAKQETPAGMNCFAKAAKTSNDTFSFQSGLQ